MGLSNSLVSFCGQGDNNVLQQSKKQRSQSVLNNIKSIMEIKINHISIHFTRRIRKNIF